MTKTCAVGIALVVLLLAASTAWAHGGQYGGGGGGGPGGGMPGGGPTTGGGVPPGTADAPATVTDWETWWAANKEAYLRLSDGMRETTGVVTPSTGETPETAVAIREARATAIRETLVPVFLEALGDDSFEVRTAAAVALGKTGDPLGSGPLVKAAREDAHQDVRDSALLALGLLGRPREIPLLDAILHDGKERTRHRSFAAFSLGLIGGEDATASLLRFLDGPGGRGVSREQPPLVASVVVALGLTRDPAALPALRAVFEDTRGDGNVRAFATLALGRLRDRQSLDALTKSLGNDREARQRRAAAVSLGKIASANDAAAVVALAEALRSDADPVVRHFAAVSVGTIGDETVLARLRAALPKSDDIDRPFLALALGLGHDAKSAPVIRKALAQEAKESIRAACSIALALLPDADARSVLEGEVRNRGQIWGQGYAALGLGMLRSKDSAPILRKELEEANDPRLRANLAVALGLLRDPKAHDYLLATLKGDGTIYERGGAAMSLGLLRMERAVPALVERWRDRREKELVRAFAIVALGVIADPADVPQLARFSIDHDYSLSIDPLNEVLSIY